MENALTANNNKIDAVVASNDATAGGAIRALTARGWPAKWRSPVRMLTWRA